VKKSSTNITLLSNPIVYSLSINLTTISDFIIFFNTLCVSIPEKGLFAGEILLAPEISSFLFVLNFYTSEL
jgi:ABC-type amino acid transport system permease subunit